MSKEEVTHCDNPECGGGSHHYYKCGNGHDICGCCIVTLSRKSLCPVCLKGAEVKV